MRFVIGGKAMISPDMRHNFLFSSSTVFMLSIHSESTGPSKISHFRSKINLFFYRPYDATTLSLVETKTFVHSIANNSMFENIVIFCSL